MWKDAINFGNDVRIWPGICSETTHTVLSQVWDLSFGLTPIPCISLNNKGKGRNVKELSMSGFLLILQPQSLLPPYETS